MADDIARAISTVPAGRWAVAVSGGADSVALARAMATRPDCTLVLAHLDHQLRGPDSDGDAAFVEALGRRLGVATEIGRRDQIETSIKNREVNASARYRAARFAFFADVARRHACDGVLLAHHADDQAESVLLRLLRGSGLPFLGGMAAVTQIAGVIVRRPLLGVPRAALRDYLNAIGQPWREDASNQSAAYRRNIVRRVLASEPSLTPLLLDLAAASQGLRRALDAATPPLDERFAVDELRRPPALAEHAARRWLVARGASDDRVSPAVVRRLLSQATLVDAPARQHYPGGLLVRRRQKHVDVIPSPALQSRDAHG